MKLTQVALNGLIATLTLLSGSLALAEDPLSRAYQDYYRAVRSQAGAGSEGTQQLSTKILDPVISQINKTQYLKVNSVLEKDPSLASTHSRGGDTSPAALLGLDGKSESMDATKSLIVRPSQRSNGRSPASDLILDGSNIPREISF